MAKEVSLVSGQRRATALPAPGCPERGRVRSAGLPGALAAATRRSGRALLCLLAFGSSSACYTFAPTEPSAVRPGMSVRVTLEAEEVLKQVEVLGGLDPVIRGEATEETTADRVALSFRRSGVSQFNSYFSAPWSSVREVEHKVFSAPRTIGVGLAGAAVVVAVLSVVNELGQSSGEGPPISNSVTVPIFRFFW